MLIHCRAVLRAGYVLSLTYSPRTNCIPIINLLRGPERCAKENTERFQSGAGADVCLVRAVRAAGQPVTKSTFRHYRVLGKGGFGEDVYVPYTYFERC
ncbi:hypothetical protein Celaphus_00017283 [Cervus elaphus hippelaphus]|uniref:Uncharacterized protein n=1 Tax=Cervus elaphus hippelaphus TaxID=46360 RepID=A0A212D6H5_CEREH|nr:hypothetical protein Celaphus_00017283 [Cervus elaphus hippelaphus]